MKKWQKATLGAMTLLAAAAIISGCDAGKKKSSDGGGSKEDVTLRFSWWGGDERHEATQKMIENFEKNNPTIKVKGEPSGFGDLDQKFTTQYAAGTEADLMTLMYNWVPQFGQNGGFYDLNKIKALDLSVYDKEFLKFGEVDGSQVAVPYGKNVIVMWLNKSAFERNGVDISTLKTWDDYKEAAKKFPKGSFPIASPTWRFPVTVYLQQKTGLSEFDDKGEMNYTEADYLEAMTWYKEMADARVFVSRKDYLENVGTEPVSLAQNKKELDGQYAGGIGWNAGISGDAAALKEVGDEAVIVDYPMIEGAKGLNLLAKPSLLFSVKKSEKHPEEIGKFFNDFLNGKEANEILGTTRGVPESKDAVKALEESGKLAGFMKDGYEYAKSAETINETPFYEDGVLTSIYTDQIEAVELGKTDLKTAANKVYTQTKEQAEKLAKQYKLK